MMHVSDREVIFIYLFTCCTLCVGGWGGIDDVALCQPRAVQLPVDPLSLLCSKKAITMLMCRSGEVNPPRRM